MQQVMGTVFFFILVAGLMALLESTNRRTAHYSRLAFCLRGIDGADLRRVRDELAYRATEEAAPGVVDAPASQQVASPAKPSEPVAPPARQSRDDVELVA